MKKKILKLFFAYSYITLLCYVGSESSLDVAKAKCGKGKERGGKIKFEWLWKTTLKRWKEMYKIISEDEG